MFKKKGLKCFGLSLALVIMLGLSLSVSSGDTNALKYSFDTFPLYQARYDDVTAPSGETFGFWFDTNQSSDLTFNDDLLSLDKSYYYARYLSNNLCQNYNYKNHIFTNFDVSSSNYTSIWSGEGTSFYRTFGFGDCQHDIVNYSYDSFFGNTYMLSTGDVENVVDIDEALFSVTSSETRYLKRVTVPLNFKADATFPANTPLSFSFGLVTRSATGFDNYSTPSVDFEVTYSSDGTSYQTTVLSCNVNDNYGFLTVRPDLTVTGNFNGFLVTCSFIPTTSVSHFSSRMIIHGSGPSYNPSSFLSYSANYGLFFSATYLVTDNDDTWSGESISPPPTGDDIPNAPGYSQLYGVETPTCLPGDFLCELSNLFGFTFINPFEPILHLFSDNNSCVNIPTVASMLNSNETQVCPWFDSNVRNIVTPVLGISSMMLVFGFAVRWLGARSGNFFEDTTDGNDVGSIHVGRRSRK